MIRVGFILADRHNGWMGGIVYLQNLLTALRDTPAAGVEPVLFVPPGMRADTLARFAGIETVTTRLVDPALPLARAGSALRLAIGRNPLLEMLLRRHRVALLSHATALGRRASVPSITWIPDFQHLHIPTLFSPAERAGRHVAFRRLIEGADAVVLSSEDARRDFAAFLPAQTARGRVLHFVSEVASAVDATPRAALEERFGLTGPYLLVANQFWPHKNHALVVTALERLAARGSFPTVVATGDLNETREPMLARGLIDRARAVGARLLVPGPVSHADLSGLMRGAAAIVNPSRFEGWNTAVEEARSLGKAVLMSDIAVHREQAPPRGIFFPADDADALASCMVAALADWSPTADASAARTAEAAVPARRAAFAEQFAVIAREVSTGRSGKRRLGD